MFSQNAFQVLQHSSWVYFAFPKPFKVSSLHDNPLRSAMTTLDGNLNMAAKLTKFRLAYIAVRNIQIYFGLSFFARYRVKILYRQNIISKQKISSFLFLIRTQREILTLTTKMLRKKRERKQTKWIETNTRDSNLRSLEANRDQNLWANGNFR